MTSYFYDCKTNEEAKKKFRELSKKLHPDNGGNGTEFSQMKEQYDRFNEEAEKEYHGGFGYHRQKQYYDDALKKGFDNAWSERQARMNEQMKQNYNSFNQGYRFNQSFNPNSSQHNDTIYDQLLKKIKEIEEIIRQKDHTIANLYDIMRDKNKYNDDQAKIIFSLRDAIQEKDSHIDSLREQVQYYKDKTHNTFWKKLYHAIFGDKK